MKTEKTVYVYHHKNFDLLTLVHQLQRKYESKVKLVGFLGIGSFLNPQELCPSILGIDRASTLRLEHYKSLLAEMEKQYRSFGFSLYKSTHYELFELQNQIPWAQNLEAAKHSLIRELTAFLEHHEISELHIPPLLGPEEEAFYDQIELSFGNGCDLIELPANTLISEEELPWSIADMPETFTQFRKGIEKLPYVSFDFASHPCFDLVGSSARERLHHFIFKTKAVSTYKQTRNGLGPGDYSSRLSQYLAPGALSVKEVGSAILHFEEQFGGNESTYWMIFELLWMYFFYFLYKKKGKSFFTPRGYKGVKSPGLGGNQKGWNFPQDQTLSPIKNHPFYLNHFNSWIQGKTKEPFINACIKELNFTGQVSNRARQCVASYLINDLNVPWWWGATWFEYKLLDYDPFSNWGNWAYLAGVGADTVPQRKFNIPLQEKKYDANKSHQKWISEQTWNSLEITIFG
jgi:deoxyribodipyrimidine photo-lyase